MTAPWTSLIDYYPHWVDYRRWYRRVPGVQVAMRVDGELVASFASGVADLDSGDGLRTDHLFRIASHSKSLAAVLVLQLLEQGRLRLDDAVSAHVGELAGSAVGDRTVGELLSHAGGVVRDSADGDFWQSMRAFPDREELLAIAHEPASAVLERNDHFKYSNIGFGLLGLVIEAVSGESFTERVRSSIATPLGLTELGGEYESARADDYAAGHTGAATSHVRSTLAHVDTRALAAATGAYATAADLTAFFAALLPGRTELLQPATVRLQRRQQWEIDPGKRHYGLGLVLDRVADTELFGHTGGYPGHITCTFADAEEQRVLSVFTNCIDGPATPIARAWFELQRLARKADHAVADDAARFTGRFAAQWGLTDVVQLDGRLFSLDPTADNPAEDAVALEPVDGTGLRIVGGHGTNAYGETMRYTFAADGAVEQVRGESAMTLRPFVTPTD